MFCFISNTLIIIVVLLQQIIAHHATFGDETFVSKNVGSTTWSWSPNT